MPLSCTQAQQKLQALKLLKTDFDFAVAKFAETGKGEDAEKVREIKYTFDEAVKELQNELPRQGEFILENIPKWDRLPDAETLGTDFGLDKIWQVEYRTDRLMTDFEVQNKTEASSIAKVVVIGDVIRQKQQKDPNRENTLTTAEILEAIDKAGYRPATLEELLAYSRDHWKPNVDIKTLTEIEKSQNVQAPNIYSLNSIFLDVGGGRSVPDLSWGDGQRYLLAFNIKCFWNAANHLLVIRKSSS